MSSPDREGAAGTIPLLEFDPDPIAMIEPSDHFGRDPSVRPEVPEVAVACFFGDAVERIARATHARRVVDLVGEHGRSPVYVTEREGRPFAFYQAGLGAPLAAAFLEEMIDYGARTVVACGGCGALDGSLALGHVVVVAEALRDEGTSFHYLPPSRTVRAEPEVVAVLTGTLERAGVPYSTGMSWSTDAYFRETRRKVARRREEGCITVEMEASALLAVARFRGVRLGQLLYAGDSLAGESWDHRNWVTAHDVREQVFWLAAEAVLELAAVGSHELRSATTDHPASPE
ncbi:MAG TPA: nucleoside phosphorylase [Acidimicrobiales bacterium]|nr:nucleoside phosphorylase [Acidimicrobiales bacterium]